MESIAFDKVVEVKWQGNPIEVKMTIPTFGGRNKIMKQCMKTKIIDGRVTQDLDEIEFKEQMLALCIVEAPFGIGIESIRKIPMTLGDRLAKELENMISLSDDEKKN